MPTYYIFLYITYQGCIKGEMYQAVGEEKKGRKWGKREGEGKREGKRRKGKILLVNGEENQWGKGKGK